MNVKNFIVAGLAGGITDFFLGWLFYGILFRNYFGGADPNLNFVFAGCMTFGFLMSYLYNGLATIDTMAMGAKVGMVIGFIIGLMENFYRASMELLQVDYQLMVIDVAICLLMGAGVGAIVGATLGTMSKKAA